MRRGGSTAIPPPTPNVDGGGGRQPVKPANPSTQTGGSRLPSRRNDTAPTFESPPRPIGTSAEHRGQRQPVAAFDRQRCHHSRRASSSEQRQHHADHVNNDSSPDERPARATSGGQRGTVTVGSVTTSPKPVLTFTTAAVGLQRPAASAVRAAGPVPPPMVARCHQAAGWHHDPQLQHHQWPRSGSKAGPTVGGGMHHPPRPAGGTLNGTGQRRQCHVYIVGGRQRPVGTGQQHQRQRAAGD